MLGKPVGFLLIFLSALLGTWPQIARAVPKQSQQVVPAQHSSQKPGSAKLLCAAQLGGAIAAITNRPQYARSQWGVLVQTLSATPHTLYTYESNRYFIPASNVKLLTTAAALRQLGPQFRYRTSIYEVAAPATTLRLVGRGDPSFTNVQLRSLAEQLRRQRIRQVDHLIVDDSYFQGTAINPSWEWEDIQADYGAPVNSLILNQNAVELQLFPQALGQPLRVAWSDPAVVVEWGIENRSITVGPQASTSVTVTRNLGRPVLQVAGQMPLGSKPQSLNLAVLEPAQQFLRHFRQALREEQLRVARTSIASAPTPGKGREIAAVASPLLPQLLIETNQESNNLYAESLLRTMGATQSPTAINSSAAGLAVVKATLTQLGVAPQSFILADGSGLSRHNLASPAALVQTLSAIAQAPQAGVFRASLPVAGVSGTLKNRFRNTPAQGILRAKTGSMSGVSALSGYLNSPNYAPLVFSILVNQSDQSGTSLRQAIDEIVLLLARLHSC